MTVHCLGIDQSFRLIIISTYVYEGTKDALGKYFLSLIGYDGKKGSGVTLARKSQPTTQCIHKRSLSAHDGPPDTISSVMFVEFSRYN